MNVLRVRVGDLILRSAGVVAAVGRAILGRPFTTLSGDHEAGATVLCFDEEQPAVQVRGYRLLGADCDEVVLVREVKGRRALIDRPLMQAYPNGSKAKVLV